MSKDVAVQKASPLFETFDTDRNLEKTGIVLQYGTTTRDGKEVPIEFTIARAGGSNTRFDKVFEVKTKPYKRMIQADSLPPEIGKRIMRETFAETVILGWNNVQDQDGEFIEFTKKNCESYMEMLPDLFTDIQVQANKQSLFRVMALEEDAKN